MSQVLQNDKSTTAWPALNQRRNQQMWVQNGTNWITNSPMPNHVQNVNQNRLQNSGIMSANTPRNPWQNNQNNIRSQLPPVNSVTTPRTSTNNRNNVNVNFINGERTNNPGVNRVVPNQHNGFNSNRESFSSGPLRGNQANSTYDSQNSRNPSTGDVDDNELREFSEALLSKETNNAAQYVTVNVQKMTTSRSTVDEAPLP